MEHPISFSKTTYIILLFMLRIDYVTIIELFRFFIIRSALLENSVRFEDLVMSVLNQWMVLNRQTQSSA